MRGKPDEELEPPRSPDQPSEDGSGRPSVRVAQEIPTGRFSRFVKLSALSAGASSRYFGQKVMGIFQSPENRAQDLFKSHLKTAEKTVEVMGNLKGAVMKVGQMISFNSDHGILPPELTNVFSRLQSQAPSLAYPAIREQIIQELQAPPEELFTEFSELPIAAASLGQVHSAVLPSGEPVVVKIQYPGIDRTVESDLWHVRSLFKAFGTLGRAAEAESIFQEVRERLTEELDYRLEAANIDFFREYFGKDPQVIIPRYFPRFSSQRVLTMEFMEGMELEEILARQPDQGWRNRLGENLFRLMLIQIFDFRRLHADPQLGNFRFREDGRIVMLDLGCVKVFDDTFVDLYMETIEAGLAGDQARFGRILADLGCLEEGHPEALRLVMELADIILRPLKERPYSYADGGRLMRDLKVIGPRFLSHPEAQGHPAMVFLHRVYMGMYFVLTRIEATGDWFAIYEQCVQQARENRRHSPPV